MTWRAGASRRVLGRAGGVSPNLRASGGASASGPNLSVRDGGVSPVPNSRGERGASAPVPNSAARGRQPPCPQLERQGELTPPARPFQRASNIVAAIVVKLLSAISRSSLGGSTELQQLARADCGIKIRRFPSAVVGVEVIAVDGRLAHYPSPEIVQASTNGSPGNSASKSSDSASLRRRASSWRSQKVIDEAGRNVRSCSSHRRASAKFPLRAWARAR